MASLLPQETYGVIERLKSLGVPNRVFADLFGVHESTTSRAFRDPDKARRFFERRPELLKVLEDLASRPEDYLRRWLLSQRAILLLRLYPLITREEAEALALEALRRERPELFGP